MVRAKDVTRLSGFTAMTLLSLPLFGKVVTVHQLQCPSTPPSYRVTGRVLDDLTGKPVSGATVELQTYCKAPDGEYPRQSVTQRDGRFVFDKVVPVDVNVRASKDDYTEPMRRPVDDSASSYKVGPHAKPIVLRLAPAASISGTVRNYEGVQLTKKSDIDIDLITIDYWAGWPRTQFVTNPDVDADGKYHFRNLSPGRYYLVANPPNGDWIRPMPHGHAPVVEEVASRYPAASPDATSYFTLREGEHAHIDFHFQQKTFHRLLASASPVPVDSCIITADGDAGYYNFEQSQDRKNYEAWLPNGTYVLSNGRNGEISGPMPFQIKDTDLIGLHFTILPQNTAWVEVPVQVSTFPLAESFCPSKIPFCFPASVQFVYLSSDGCGEASGGYAWKNSGSSQDHAESPSSVLLVPGKYAVVIETAENIYAKSIRSGSTDLADAPLVLSYGESLAPVQVVLAKGATIDGIVKSNGKPAQAWVYAVAEDIETKIDFREFNSVTSDENGTFHITGLAPGSYLFFASNYELGNFNVHDPGDVAFWRSHGKVADVRVDKPAKLVLTSVDPPDM